MQVENPIRLVRELKGAPISILLVLGFAAQRVTQEWLERATGYTDKPVSQALAYLQEIGLVDHSRSGWQLTGEARQLPLGLALEERTTETQSSEEIQEEEAVPSKNDGTLGAEERPSSRNISDSIAAAAINLISLDLKDIKSSCCSSEGRNFSDSDPDPGWGNDLVREILRCEGIGPPKLDSLARLGLDPLWVRAHVGQWRQDGKSKGILITRLECGDDIRYDRNRVERALMEEFPDFWEDEE